METNIVITENPGIGKSTVLKQRVAETTVYQNKIGFVANQVLNHLQIRTGFEMENHLGQKTLFADKKWRNSSLVKVSSYGVDVAAMENIFRSTHSLLKTVDSETLLYLDEIGQMQLSSETFKRMVTDFLTSPNTFIATMSSIFPCDFIEEIKKRDDVIMVQLYEGNRGFQEEYIKGLLEKISKARSYISQPERFTFSGESIIVQSKSKERIVILSPGRNTCTCWFSKHYDTCSHIIAAKEMVKRRQST